MARKPVPKVPVLLMPSIEPLPTTGTSRTAHPLGSKMKVEKGSGGRKQPVQAVAPKAGTGFAQAAMAPMIAVLEDQMMKRRGRMVHVIAG